MVLRRLLCGLLFAVLALASQLDTVALRSLIDADVGYDRAGDAQRPAPAYALASLGAVDDDSKRQLRTSDPPHYLLAIAAAATEAVRFVSITNRHERDFEIVRPPSCAAPPTGPPVFHATA